MKKIDWNKVLPIIMSALSAIISILTTFFVAKPLGAELYGQVQYYVGVITVFSIISAFGLSDYFIKTTQYSENHKEHFGKWILLMTIIDFIITPVFMIIVFFVLKDFEKNLILILIVALCGLSQSFLNVIGGYLLGRFEQAKSLFFSNFLPKLLILIVSTIFLNFLPRDEFYWYYLLALLTINLIIGIPIIATQFRLSKGKFKFTKTEFIALFSFFALSATYSLNHQLSKIIGSEVYKNLSGVGAFSISVQLAAISTLFASTVISMSKPYFSKLKDNKTELIIYFRKITRVNSYIVIPFCSALIIQSQRILSVFDKPDSLYSSYYWILVVLCIGVLISNLFGPNGTLLAMSGHEKVEVINGIVNIIVYIICAFSFVSFGIIGLAIATLVASMVVNILKYIEVLYFYKINPYSLKLFLHFAIMIVISFLSFYLASFIKNIYILIAVDAFIGIGLIILFNVVNPNKEDKYFFLNSSKNREV